MKIEKNIVGYHQNMFLSILAHITYIFMNTFENLGPSSKNQGRKKMQNGNRPFDKSCSEIARTHTIYLQIPEISDFRPTLDGCNFAHTCRRVKLFGVR